MATAAAMPDMKTSNPGLTSVSGSTSSGRLAATSQTNRGIDRLNAGSDATALDIWRLPMTAYTVTPSPFGESAGTLSRGIDLAAPIGTPLFASHSGTVSLARWYGGYGYTVIIDIGNGVQLVYGHASSLLVHEGQHVDSGQLVALSGNSGYSFSPHVHFEIRVHGVATDPVQYMLDHGVDIAKHSDSLTA
jgi:murein DD-endopeptidase MepM/ murein hydrolase activator NlpD